VVESSRALSSNARGRLIHVGAIIAYHVHRSVYAGQNDSKVSSVYLRAQDLGFQHNHQSHSFKMMSLTLRSTKLGPYGTRSTKHAFQFPVRSLTTRLPVSNRLTSRCRSTLTTTSSSRPAHSNGLGQTHLGRHHRLTHPTAEQLIEYDSVDEQYERDERYYWQVTTAFGKALQQAERKFYMELPIELGRKLGLEGRPPWAGLVRYSTHFEIILALDGRKPSVLFYTDFGTPSATVDALTVFGKYVETVFLPLFREYELEKYGYIVQKIPHKIIVNGRENWVGAWVLADTRSESWDVVKQVFFDPKDAKHRISITGAALGFPVVPGLEDYGMRYTMFNETATQELRRIYGPDVEPVFAMEYVASEDDIQIEDSHTYFDWCQAIATKHNIELTLQYCRSY
jgi:hypothetical protein